MASTSLTLSLHHIIVFQQKTVKLRLALQFLEALLDTITVLLFCEF